ncbi:MAG: hypothetical protein LBV50_07280, partial [Novosphingobium sp.]|nr:hypothetical protein [Novosphingobium sp.]
ALIRDQMIRLIKKRNSTATACTGLLIGFAARFGQGAQVGKIDTCPKGYPRSVAMRCDDVPGT